MINAKDFEMEYEDFADMLRRRDQSAIHAHFVSTYIASLSKPDGFMVHDAFESTFFHFCGNPMRGNKIDVTNRFNCGAMPINGWTAHATLQEGDFFRRINNERQIALHLVLAAGPAIRSYEDTQQGYSISLIAEEVRGYRGGVGINGADEPKPKGWSFI